MNPSDFSRLPLDLWKDLHDVRVLWQLALLGAGFVIAWWANRLLEPRFASENRALHITLGGLQRLQFPLTTLAVVLVFQVVQRWANFAIANPARQVFYTVLAREEKYKAKNLIDVVIYRGSDALYGWVFDALQALGLKLAAIALCALPVAAGWLVLSGALGRAQERRAARIAAVVQGD